MAPNAVSLNSLEFSLVGPGKVGSSLAHWLVSKGARLRHIASRNPESARRLADRLGGHPTVLSQIDTAEEDLLLLAVSDPALQEVAEALAGRQQASVALHTSGRSTGEVLAPLRKGGSAIGSLHPLKAFPSVLEDLAEASSTVFGIDGDPSAQEMARRLALGFSGVATFIPPGARMAYHLAATVAAGGVVTLVASAAELAQSLGLDPEVVTGYLQLAEGAVLKAQTSDPIAAAITGPIARGDVEGFQTQIDQIKKLDPKLAELLELLAERTLHHCRSLSDEGPKLPRS